MLTRQVLQQILIDSEIAQQYFRDAQNGLFLDPHFHDLFYDTQHDQICSQTSKLEPSLQDTKQLILRIHGGEQTQYIWPDIDFKEFVSVCLQEYSRFFHTDVSQLLQPQEVQQQKTQQHQKELLHDELEL